MSEPTTATLSIEQQLCLEEWKEIRETIRYFGNKRFAQLTVFLGATAFMFGEFFKGEGGMYRTGLIVGGGILGFLFVLIDYRNFLYVDIFVERGEALENDTLKPIKMMTLRRKVPEKKGENVSQVATRSKWRLETYSVRAIYSVTVLTWIITGLACFVLPSRADSFDAIRTVKTHIDAISEASGEEDTKWTFQSMRFDTAKEAYEVEFTKQDDGNVCVVVIDARSGQVISSVRRGVGKDIDKGVTNPKSTH